MTHRSPARIVVSTLLLLVLYAVSYHYGIVQAFTAKIGVSDPGPLREPAGLHNADLSHLIPGDDHTVSADARDALRALDSLRVAGRVSMAGYARDQFGPAWADTDGNGCDTRNDVLRRDLTGASTDPATAGCVVTAGTLADPYTGRTITFTRGQATSTAVQIDHVVSLGDAWATGAQALSADRRRELANDPANLLAVDGPTNEAKGDRDASEWLPPNEAARCTYAITQVRVKAAYGLWVTGPEKRALEDVLRTCP